MTWAKLPPKHEIILKKTLPVKVFADPDRISQVLINLISNALKYSPDNMPAVIMIRGSYNFLTCTVEDFGADIPKNEQSKLFQKFSLLTRVNHSESPCIGLGLYISAEIIKQENGKIWVESIQNEGSTFCFRLPLKGGDKV